MIQPTSTGTACPICQQPLAGQPVTTTVDNEPYLKRREPPVSVRVHRACLQALAAPVRTALPATLEVRHA